MYNVYAYYSRAMFVYFNRLLFKSISLLPLLHFISLLPFFPHLPFLYLLPFSPPLLVDFPPSLPSNLSISSSSLIPPLLSFRSLLSLIASFPSNPLFFLIPPLIQPLLFSTPSFFPTLQSFLSLFSILSLLSILPLQSVIPLLPLHSFLPFHSFLSLLPIIPLFSFLSLLLLLPFFSLYPSFTCSPPSLPLPHFFSPTSSLHLILSHHSFHSYLSIISYTL